MGFMRARYVPGAPRSIHIAELGGWNHARPAVSTVGASTWAQGF